MTVEDVRDRVEKIRLAAGDDEVAHSREDRLHQDVLAHIASGGSDAAALAAEALRTTEIDFSRWCA